MSGDNLAAGHRQRLRQRFITNGVRGFLDYEILELMLTYSILRKDVKPLAKMLLRKFGSLRDVINAPVEKLCEISGIDERSAVLISLFRQVHSECMQETFKSSTLNFSDYDLSENLHMVFNNSNQESCAVLLYDSSGRMIISKVWDGELNSVNAPIGNIVLFAANNKAKVVVLAHNHPRGTTEFSSIDVNTTRSICAALKVFNIEMYDHVLVKGKQTYSMREKLI